MILRIIKLRQKTFAEISLIMKQSHCDRERIQKYHVICEYYSQMNFSGIEDLMFNTGVSTKSEGTRAWPGAQKKVLVHCVAQSTILAIMIATKIGRLLLCRKLLTVPNCYALRIVIHFHDLVLISM